MPNAGILLIAPRRTGPAQGRVRATSIAGDEQIASRSRRAGDGLKRYASDWIDPQAGDHPILPNGELPCVDNLPRLINGLIHVLRWKGLCVSDYSVVWHSVAFPVSTIRPGLLLGATLARPEAR